MNIKLLLVTLLLVAVAFLIIGIKLLITKNDTFKKSCSCSLNQKKGCGCEDNDSSK